MSSIFSDIRDRSASAAVSLQKSMSPLKFMAIIGIAVGLLAGFGAALLKDLITWLTDFVEGIFPPDQFNVLLLFLPILGVLLCGIYSRYIVKDDMEFSCERIAGYLNSGNYRLPRHLCYAPIIACSLTLGLGGSAGSEGPIAYAGAGIGSNLGKYLRLPPDIMRTLVIIGAAAGIAGIFKAPIGGAMFALEVLAMPMTTVGVIALVFSCLAAGCMAYAWSGFTIDVAYLPKNFFDPAVTGGVALLGLFCGLYSLYYSYMSVKTENVFKKIRNPWVKNLVSGALIGVMLFVFPVLYGEGYGVLNEVINGNDGQLLRDTRFFGNDGPWMLILFVGCVVLIKSVATATTNSGGGVGGDFAPTLFAGCMAGMLFAYASNTIFGTGLDVANFALFGMAGVMSGALQAPLMGIFLTQEMVGDFAMFFPLTVCALISFATVRLLHGHFRVSFRATWLHGLVKKL